MNSCACKECFDIAAVANQKVYTDLSDWEGYIQEAYKTTNRTILGIVTNLQCEASELAELVVKKEWYEKEYTQAEVLSEAGDILNFLTILLLRHDLTLEEAMDNNIKKLKNRNWIK